MQMEPRSPPPLRSMPRMLRTRTHRSTSLPSVAERRRSLRRSHCYPGLTAVIGSVGFQETAVTLTGRFNLPPGTNIIPTHCDHDFNCQLEQAGTEIYGNVNSNCPQPATISSPPPSSAG